MGIFVDMQKIMCLNSVPLLHFIEARGHKKPVKWFLMSWVKVLKGHLINNTEEEESGIFPKKRDVWPVEDYSISKDQSDEV